VFAADLDLKWPAAVGKSKLSISLEQFDVHQPCYFVLKKEWYWGSLYSVVEKVSPLGRHTENGENHDNLRQLCTVGVHLAEVSYEDLVGVHLADVSYEDLVGVHLAEVSYEDLVGYT
jgi:hypothetical protein